MLGPALLVLLVVAALFLVRRPGDPALYPAATGEPTVRVFLLDNGFHTNIAVQRDRLLASGGPAASAARSLPDAPWVAVGWGDRRFFTESGLSLSRAADALRAAFAPGNPAVVMYEPLRTSPDRLYRTGVLELRLTERGFERMIARLDASFLLRNGAPVPGPRGPVPQARFFESVETFSVLRLCNHWTADLLNAAGVPTRPMLGVWGAGLSWDVGTGAARLESAADVKRRH